MDDVEWRVGTHIGPHGNVRERHAYRHLSGHIAQAWCEQTAFTAQLEPDDDTARACPLCVLFVSVALADQQDDGDRGRAPE